MANADLKMINTKAILCALAACYGSAIHAQTKSPPADSVLAGITQRGRAIASYDFAAWHGSDAVMVLKPSASLVTHYIARQTPRGWQLAFGKLNERRDAFMLAFEASPTGPANVNDGYVATAHTPPIVDTGYFRRAALALDTATAAFGSAQRPYNSVVLPVGDGRWWVYLMPAPTVPNVFPLGADVRFLVAADGRQILERRKLHNSIIEYSAKSLNENGKQLMTSVHSAVLDNIPEDTDVFHVLSRTPKVPELVITDAFAFRIEVDGTVKYLGKREDIVK